MSNSKKKSIKAMIDYLKNDAASGKYSGEVLESIEVAIDCLHNAYGISKNTSDSAPTSSTFFEQFENFLLTYDENQEHASCTDKLAQGNSQTNETAESLKEEGNSLMQQGNYTKALRMYTRAIQLNNNNAAYYCNRAAAYMKLKDYHSAISDCNTALQIDPKFSKAFARLGMAHASLKNLKKGTEYLKIALSMDPENVSYQNNVKLIEEMQTQMPNLPPIFNNPDLIAFAQEMFSDPSMSILSRRMMDHLYPEMTRQLGGDQNLLPPQNPNEKKEG